MSFSADEFQLNSKIAYILKCIHKYINMYECLSAVIRDIYAQKKTKKISKPNPNLTFITLKKESKKSLLKKNGKKHPKIVFLIVKSSFFELKNIFKTINFQITSITLSFFAPNWSKNFSTIGNFFWKTLMSNHDWKGYNMIYHSTLSDDYLWWLISRGKKNYNNRKRLLHIFNGCRKKTSRCCLEWCSISE